jgi:hypothetical protein
MLAPYVECDFAFILRLPCKRLCYIRVIAISMGLLGDTNVANMYFVVIAIATHQDI